MNKVCKLSTDFLFLHEYREIRKRKLVVMCHGCFDVLHYGHLIHLNSARAKGDYLIVSLAGDAFVNKGTGKPVFDQYKRAAMLAAFSIIDRVVITETLGPFEHIKALRPHFYRRGRTTTTLLPRRPISFGSAVAKSFSPKTRRT